MHRTKTIATLIVRQYKNGESLTESENKKLEKWKAQSPKNEKKLISLADIFTTKGEFPLVPPTEISVIIFKQRTNFGGPLSDTQLDQLMKWRALSPEYEDLYHRITRPNPVLASINIKREMRKIKWHSFRIQLAGLIRKWLGQPATNKKRISEQTVALIQQVLKA